MVGRRQPPAVVMQRTGVQEYRAWVMRAAIFHASRDRARGHSGARSVHYARMIHRGVCEYDGRCAYTGAILDWQRIGAWDADAARGGGEDCAGFDLLPSVDHVTVSEPVRLEICAWWFNRAKGCGSLATTLQKFSAALQAHDARREWNRERQLRETHADADHWLPGTRLRELPPVVESAESVATRRRPAVATVGQQPAKLKKSAKQAKQAKRRGNPVPLWVTEWSAEAGVAPARRASRAPGKKEQERARRAADRVARVMWSEWKREREPDPRVSLCSAGAEDRPHQDQGAHGGENHQDAADVVNELVGGVLHHQAGADEHAAEHDAAGEPVDHAFNGLEAAFRRG